MRLSDEIMTRYNVDVNIVVVGNCQVVALARSLAYIHPGASVIWFAETQFNDAGFTTRFLDAFASADYVIEMPSSSLRHALAGAAVASPAHLIEVPPVVFRGFHPDCVYAFDENDNVVSSVSPYHSAILLWAYKNHISASEAQSLFRDDVFRGLGYHRTYMQEIGVLLDSFGRTGIDTARWWRTLRRLGVFMHTINHPRASVLASLAVELSISLSLPERRDVPLERYVQEEALASYVWPIYPEIAAELGTVGLYEFQLGPVSFHDLPSYIEASWNAYATVDFETLRCPRIDEEAFVKTLTSHL